MPDKQLFCGFYSKDPMENRKKMFSKALICAKNGKVLYILSEQLNELPELSQDLNQVDRHYIKMISFLYASNLQSLIESVVTLPTWQNIPSTIILDDLSAYCSQDNFHMACGTIALLLDTAKCCSKLLKTTCRFYIAVPNYAFKSDQLNTLQELYFTKTNEEAIEAL